MTAVTGIADPLPEAADGLARVAVALRSYARELEDAQRDADRAREAVQAAQVAVATATNLLTELAAVPDPEPTTVAHLQGRLQQAGDDLTAATTAGQKAYERARDAARTAASAIDGVAAMAPAPPPPPPPPPPPEDDRPWYEKAASGAWGGLKDAGGFVGDTASDGSRMAGEMARRGCPARPRSEPTSSRRCRVIGGTGVFLWQLTKATSPLYKHLDPEGAHEARDGFKEGFAYAWDHPWETGKQVLGIHHLENGEPGKFTGEVGAGRAARARDRRRRRDGAARPGRLARLAAAGGGQRGGRRCGQGSSHAARRPARQALVTDRPARPAPPCPGRHVPDVDVQRGPAHRAAPVLPRLRGSVEDAARALEPGAVERADGLDARERHPAGVGQQRDDARGDRGAGRHNGLRGPVRAAAAFPGGRTQVVITEVKPEWVVP